MTTVVSMDGKKTKSKTRVRKGIDPELPSRPPAPQQPNTKAPSRWTEMFEVPLTAKEMEHKASEMTRMLDDLDDLEAQRKAAVANIKAKIDERKADLREIRRVRRAGAEDREVEVYEEFVWWNNTVRVIRSDTGEVVRERAMRADERQEELPLASDREPQSKSRPHAEDDPVVTDPQAVLDAEVGLIGEGEAK